MSYKTSIWDAKGRLNVESNLTSGTVGKIVEVEKLSNNYSFTPAFSFSFFVEVPEVSTNPNITFFELGQGTTFPIYILLRYDGSVANPGINYTLKASGILTNSTATYTFSGGKHHVVFQADGTNLEIYVDSILIEQKSYNKDVDAKEETLKVLKDEEFGLSHFTVFNAALTFEEIGHIHRTGGSVPLTAHSSCIAHYPLTQRLYPLSPDPDQYWAFDVAGQYNYAKTVTSLFAYYQITDPSISSTPFSQIGLLLAQTFTPDTAIPTDFSLFADLRKTAGSNPVGQIEAQITEVDGAGNPDLTKVIATATALVDVSLLESTQSDKGEFIFTATTLAVNTTYALVLKYVSGTLNRVQFIRSTGDAKAGVKGQYSLNAGTTWADIATNGSDYLFTIGIQVKGIVNANAITKVFSENDVDNQTTAIGTLVQDFYNKTTLQVYEPPVSGSPENNIETLSTFPPRYRGLTFDTLKSQKASLAFSGFPTDNQELTLFIAFKEVSQPTGNRYLFAANDGGVANTNNYINVLRKNSQTTWNVVARKANNTVFHSHLVDLGIETLQPVTTIAFSANQETSKIYINGVERSSFSNPAAELPDITAFTQLVLNGYTGNGFDGDTQIMYCGLWSRQLSIREVNILNNNTFLQNPTLKEQANLELFIEFNAIVNNTPPELKDLSPNNFDLTLQGYADAQEATDALVVIDSLRAPIAKAPKVAEYLLINPTDSTLIEAVDKLQIQGGVPPAVADEALTIDGTEELGINTTEELVIN